MKTIIHRANTRGTADYGWLLSRHTFSFAEYFNPDRIHFGALRVLNDDIVQTSMGFGTHPHSNMEIISIPLSGVLKHKDSMGVESLLKRGDIQIMSAGTGIYHSEFNNSDSEEVCFLQIWILPKHQDVKPRYEQKAFSFDQHENIFQLIVSPDGDGGSLMINQDAWFSIATLNENKSLEYSLRNELNAVYVFVIEGSVKINGNILKKRDGVGLIDHVSTRIEAETRSEILVMEVTMNAG